MLFQYDSRDKENTRRVHFEKVRAKNQQITEKYINPLLPVLENIRKPKGFLMFPGGIDKQHWAVMG